MGHEHARPEGSVSLGKPMSDKRSETRSTGHWPGRMLGGLAASVILGTPVVAVAAEPVAAEPVGAVSTSAAPRPCAAQLDSTGSSIRDQFRSSFTAGPITDPVVELPMIICNT